MHSLRIVTMMTLVICMFFIFTYTVHNLASTSSASSAHAAYAEAAMGGIPRPESPQTSSQRSFQLEAGVDSVGDSESSSLSSGVGLVTQDGMWPDAPTEEDIKIIAFTDVNYVPIAKVWYQRLSDLGYTEHYIVASDEQSLATLTKENYRVIPLMLNATDLRARNKFARQLFYLRLVLTRDLLLNGTHLLLTDLDNIFNRYVPLSGFLTLGNYDVYHAYEMRYPPRFFKETGFVVCAGHQFLRATNATVAYLERVMDRCLGGECDDQVHYNKALLFAMNMVWDVEPNRPEALRVESSLEENAGLLVESFSGHSNSSEFLNSTNGVPLKVKVWDRDFAWRLVDDLPERCPSKNNWVAMPTKNVHPKLEGLDKVAVKIKMFEIWDELCRGISQDE